jgi:hypothetical protein
MNTVMEKDDVGDGGNNKKVQYYHLIVFTIFAVLCFVGLYYIVTHLVAMLDLMNGFPLNLFGAIFGLIVLGAGLVISVVMIHESILRLLR